MGGAALEADSASIWTEIYLLLPMPPNDKVNEEDQDLDIQVSFYNPIANQC
jgi:hypothetical protein